LVGKGVPMALQMSVLSLSMVFMISLVNRFGIDTAAAYGAGVQVWNYIQMPSFAIGMAVSSMAAQNIGAQKWDRIVIITRMGVIYQLALTGTMVLIIDLFCRSALGLFLPAGSIAVDIGVHMNYIVTWSFMFFGISMVLFGVVRANGAVIAPLIVLAISLLGIRFPLALALLDRLQVDAIWWSFPASSFVAILMAMAYYKWGKWRSIRLITPHAAAAQAAAATAEIG
jgi:Na+-driven multidrug efflux pump